MPGGRSLPSATRTRSRVLLAMGLAILTLPVTAYGIAMIAVPDVPETADWVSPASEPGLLLATTALAVIAASIAGSLVADRVRNASARVAWTIAVFGSWAVAIAVLPVLPVLLGQPFDVGYWCIDGCNPAISAGSLVAGIEAWGLSFIPAIFVVMLVLTPGGAVVVAVLAIVGVVLVWQGHVMTALTLAIVGAIGIAHGFSIGQAPIPFAVLVAGATAWTLLTRPSPEQRIARDVAPPWAPPAA